MSDLISRQSAIDAVESAKTARTPDGEIYVAKLNVEMNIQILPSAQPERGCDECIFKPFKQFQPKWRWISVKDRLPDKKGYYLVVRKNPKGHVTRARFDPEQVERGVYNSPWGNGDCDILAWMPMPEWREDGED